MMAGKLKAEATNILRLICVTFAAILQSLISICRVLSCNADKKLQHNAKSEINSNNISLLEQKLTWKSLLDFHKFLPASLQQE